MKCSNCGSEQPDDVVFCNNCGSRLRGYISQDDRRQGTGNQIINEQNNQIINEREITNYTGVQKDAPTRYCPNCGAPMPIGAAFCTECGQSAAAPFGEAPSGGTSSAPQPSKEKIRLW